MNEIKVDLTSACEDAAKHAFTDFIEALLPWLPVALSLDVRTNLGGLVKDGMQRKVAQLLDKDLLGVNILEADAKLRTATDGAKYSGTLMDLAVKGPGPGVIGQLSVEAKLDPPLPLRADKHLTATVDADAHVTSELHAQDRKWHTKSSVTLTLNVVWSWEQESAQPT